MIVRFTRQAVADLRKAGDYIARENPEAARRTMRRIRAAARGLRRFPDKGRPGRVEGTRELVVSGTPFLMPYRVIGDEIFILAVMHGMRAWPEAFDPP